MANPRLMIPQFMRHTNSMIINFILIISTLFGLAPCTFIIGNTPTSASTVVLSYSRRRCVYNILLATFLITINGFLLVNINKETDMTKLKTQLFIEICAVIIANFLSTTIIIIFYLNHKNLFTLADLWNDIAVKKSELQILKIEIFNSNPCFEETAFEKDTKMKILLKFACGVLLQMGLIITTSMRISITCVMTDVLSEIICTTLLIQYHAILSFLKNEMNYLNKILLSLGQSLIKYSSKDVYILRSIDKTLEIRRILVKMIISIEIFYSPTVLLAVLWCFVALMINIFKYLVIPYSFNDQRVMVVEHSIRFVLNGYSLLILCLTVENIIQEVNKTKNVISYILSRHLLKERQRVSLRNYSLELLHEDISFTAYGFFSLDSSLLMSICNAIIVYQIVLHQEFKSQ